MEVLVLKSKLLKLVLIVFLDHRLNVLMVKGHKNNGCTYVEIKTSQYCNNQHIVIFFKINIINFFLFVLFC
jgi:hypothetical protein